MADRQHRGHDAFSDDRSRHRSGGRGAGHAAWEDPGPHRGRGPRGHRRSDDRIREDVNDRLTDDFFVDATEITVSVADGEVTLNGTVNNRGERRRAEQIAEDVLCVTHVQNDLRVSREGAAVKE